ncbi:unnamed protein product [Gongylonema pulchrum]|uniref:ubiquitinyl hydrolase 1 n=1 Tax=Gongylonema pulchrum TaxID=637853 RepID=A0A3P7P7V2_9BILA|nr:unnamed protein product [Gongylonema pulchrum]
MREALSKYSGSLPDVTSAVASGDGGSKAVTVAVRDLYRMMDDERAKNHGSVLHNVFPQFATRGEHGWMQQDANECWAEVLRALRTQLKGTGEEIFARNRLNMCNIAETEDHTASIISRFMEGKFKIEMKNLESDAEPSTVTTESFSQLSCFLSQEVKYVQLGIKSKMTEEIVKNSVVLGRDAKYEKKTLIDRLPAYLSIQMVRFFYKEKDKVNAKILKDVKFPLLLDLYDMCTPELQQKLMPARDAFKVFLTNSVFSHMK